MLLQQIYVDMNVKGTLATIFNFHFLYVDALNLHLCKQLHMQIKSLNVQILVIVLIFFMIQSSGVECSCTLQN
jgi:hypothetical protein